METARTPPISKALGSREGIPHKLARSVYCTSKGDGWFAGLGNDFHLSRLGHTLYPGESGTETLGINGFSRPGSGVGAPRNRRSHLSEDRGGADYVYSTRDSTVSARSVTILLGFPSASNVRGTGQFPGCFANQSTNSW